MYSPPLVALALKYLRCETKDNQPLYKNGKNEGRVTVSAYTMYSRSSVCCENNKLSDKPLQDHSFASVEVWMNNSVQHFHCYLYLKEVNLYSEWYA